MHEGYSWSGHERNCGFLNLRDGTFVDASAALGFDFLDDGRSLAVCDWDGDGDLDVWLKNRTGPQVRFLRNDGTAKSHFIAFKLIGRMCNRDAVGAKITVESGGRARVRTLCAGDGYLAQSSKWLHFGLGARETIDRVVIRWPDATTQALAGLAADRRYVIEQAAGAPGSPPGAPPVVRAVPPRSTRLAAASAARPEAGESARLVLKVPLPLPPSLVDGLFGEDSGARRARLVTLWAQWCAPCRAELARFSEDYERLHDSGLDILALNVDNAADRGKARAFFERKIAPRMGARAFAERAATAIELEALAAILHHVRDKRADWPLPTSLLFNPHGTLQIIYLGPVGVDRLAADAADYGLHTRPLHRRSSFPGRWYFRTPRNLPELARDLRRRGLGDAARFYAVLDRAVRRPGRRLP